MAFLRSHILILILVLAGAATFLWLLRFRARLRMTAWAALGLSILHVLFGVFCVRIFARFEGASAGSMSIFGAVFFMPVGYFLGAKLFRRPAADVFDVFAVPMIFTLFCSRINCLVSGCCLGLTIGNTPFRWPTRETEMLFYLIFLALTAPRVLRGGMRGRLYPIYMIAYGVFRGVNECFRYSSETQGLFHRAHIWAAISIAVGLAVWLLLRRRQAQTDQT